MLKRILTLAAPALLISGILLSSCTAPLRQTSRFCISDAMIITDPGDAQVVQKTAALLSEDVRRVTGHAMPASAERRVIIGTVGQSAPIDSLVADGMLDVSEITGGWERYIVQAVDANTLAVAGSDRRGTAYGVFHLSEQIGVNPYYWWADVPSRRSEKSFVNGKRYVSKTPSIKYRGVFINDEDWGLKTWSALNFEKELGDIGPRTYDKVCELLLRLGGNMVAPAMHSCTGAFYSHPESKEVADSWGILITTSHCEPLLFNNAAKSEWDSKVDGAWNYRTNKETIWKKLDDRVAEAGMYENIYTVAMRGVHDAGLVGEFTPQERVQVLTDVITDQREILRNHIGKDPEEIPQIFVPYKETLDVYELGLQVPDDVTIVWPDDNYGYLKRVSNPEEQKRAGGAGVYYHFSYLGAPHDYLWINTTPPVLMYEELRKAYDNGADRYWLLNVGDIKPAELGIKTFFDLARDIDAYDIRSINRHQAAFLADIYGKQYEKRFQALLDEYYRLAWNRKPEFMGWEREWDRRDLADIMDTDFSFGNYQDAQWRLADYTRISDEAAALLAEVPEAYRPSLFEMLGYPVLGANQMNRKFLLAQLNHLKAADGAFAQAEWAGIQAKAAYDSIAALTQIYNIQLDGKWNEMMHIPPGYVARYQNMPRLEMTGAEPEAVDLTPGRVSLEGCMMLDLSQCPTRIEGIGYDWVSAEIKDLSFNLPAIPADSVTVHIWTVPFWPLYEGVGNRYSVALDGSDPRMISNGFVEYGDSWKDQVLQNGHEAVVSLPLDRSAKKHVLRLQAVDPGQIVERIVIDWGGLKPSYVGPSSGSL